MIQRLRLLSGLVLLTYVTTHLLNHAVGIFSVETAEVPRQWFIAFWRNPLLTVVLYTSLLTHISLALLAIYPAWLRQAVPPLPPGGPSLMDNGIVLVLVLWVGAVAATFAARGARAAWQARRAQVLVTYPDGRRRAILPGTTLLEASRLLG